MVTIRVGFGVDVGPIIVTGAGLLFTIFDTVPNILMPVERAEAMGIT